MHTFLVSRETPDSDNDATCAELKADEGWKSSMMKHSTSRPVSIISESNTSGTEKRWVNIVSGKANSRMLVRVESLKNCMLFLVPLMMAYVTRYIFGTDKLRSNAFEVRGLNGISTGIINCDDLAIFSQWLKMITDNIVGLTLLQVINDTIQKSNFIVEEMIKN